MYEYTYLESGIDFSSGCLCEGTCIDRRTLATCISATCPFAARTFRTRTDGFEQQRLEMVEKTIEARGVEDENVLEVMRRVPRHLFVPPDFIEAAYEDHPLPIGYGQTISQPYIVAFMTEQLDPKPGDKVLEIGTGSGYQALKSVSVHISFSTNSPLYIERLLLMVPGKHWQSGRQAQAKAHICLAR
jgi:hypothetical protein